MSKHICSIYLTKDKKRIGTNDYGTFMGNKFIAPILKGIYLELQKLNAQKQKAT